MGLANLPAPRNDFEIVLEEDLPDGQLEEALSGERAEDYVPDMGDEEEKYQRELEARKQYELSKRHAPLKKGLPRPSAVNESILRAKDIQLNPLQEAEELIKKEMLVMLHYDAINHPADNQISSKHNKRAQLPAR